MRSELQQDWAGKWLAEKLSQHDSVASATSAPDNQEVRVERKASSPVVLYATSVETIEADDVADIVDQVLGVDAIVNIKKGGHVTGAAMRAAEEAGVGVLGMGDAMRALRDEDRLADYISPEVVFVSRGLRQHGAVDGIERLDESRYLVRREDLGDVTVLVATDYELTASRVRELIDAYDRFDAIAASNPNGTVTEEATEVARVTGIRILQWGPLLGALNNRWT